jgi:hypothetical protein
MKNLFRYSPALALTLMTSSFSFAGATSDPTPPEPKYDVSTVVDITATITDVREVAAGKPMAGIHLMVQAGPESLDIYVAPTEFVKIFDVAFAKGETLKVIGSVVKFDGAKIVLAKDIVLGSVTLSVRDKAGEPLWKFFLKPPVG